MGIGRGSSARIGTTLRGLAAAGAAFGVLAGFWSAGGTAALVFALPVAAVFAPMVAGRYPGEGAIHRARAARAAADAKPRLASATPAVQKTRLQDEVPLAQVDLT